jgi:PleD family two-component response regulator
MLPELNGYEVCARLRNISLTKHIPVIFLTQKDGRADIVEGLQLGADDYIAKPFDVDELRLRVQRSIERATRESLYDSRTGLPTGPMAEEEIARKQLEDDIYSETHFTIAGFDAFNDKYGFMSADQVMAYAAKCLFETVVQHGTPDDFVGYIDNRFIVLTKVDDADALLKQAVQTFNEGSRAFYTFIDVDQNGIIVNEGDTNEYLAPLMQMTVHQNVDV